MDKVSQKLVSMINRNILEGCTLNIYIETNMSMHVYERFVFLTKGTLDNIKPNGNSHEKR